MLYSPSLPQPGDLVLPRVAVNQQHPGNLRDTSVSAWFSAGNYQRNAIMETVSFENIAIVSCGTMSIELNYLKKADEAERNRIKDEIAP